MATVIDFKVLRCALGSFATGVTIVTTRDAAGVDTGLTANSFNSVSLDPPMVLWSLAKASLSLRAFNESSNFAVHVLAADQEPLSNLFARRGADKFAGLGLDMERGEGGVPLLPGCTARFVCRTAFRYDGGDHSIFVGEVISLDHFPRAPLVFHGGAYAVAARKAADLSAVARPPESQGGYTEDFFGYLLGRAHFQMYARVQQHLDRHELSSADHFVLSVLGVADARTREEVGLLIAYTGIRVTDALIERLELRGLLTTRSERLHLTEAGRRMNIELMAVAKAAEADALMHLDYSEAQMLKHLLKRVIHGTDPGVPDLWASCANGG